MRRRARIVLVILALFVVTGLLAWRYQSQIIGRTAEWYLVWQASREANEADVTHRRSVVAAVNRQLLMPPPPDAYVPELYEVITLVARRVAVGEMSFAWMAHLYTSYHRDLALERPSGEPRRSPDEIRAQIDRYVEFYAIQKRPDVKGVTMDDLLGTGDDVITLEEIEEAERTGKDIDLRTRGAQ
jgi:hypothetical protein